MIKTIVLTGLVLLSQTLLAAMIEEKIECAFKPRLYVGNVQFDIDTKSKSFKLTYDDPRNQNNKIVAVQGQVYIGQKDSMGYDKIGLCTGEPCSGKTYLGGLKAVNQAKGNFPDRVSYFSFNPNSEVKIKVLRFNRWTFVSGLSELSCNYL